MLGAGGAGTYAQQAIPRTVVSPGCALSWSSVAGLFGCSSCSALPGVHSRRVIRVWGGASHGRVMVASRMTEDYVRSVARLAYLWAPFSPVHAREEDLQRGQAALAKIRKIA
jgi:hypothetical protein